ncbi:importin-beta like protein [Scheffersomyces coipomensis]|uniref:importin-beta like protein n=1 Tax=Scheffersomyces coipomensis TaxID=1788519 RepID=UPI00315D3947
MNKDNLIKIVQGTLDADNNIRKHSEQELHVYERQPGFTEYLLDLISEPGISSGVQLSVSVFFKNRVVNHWLAPENSKDTSKTIADNEKPGIKEKLVHTIMKTYQHQVICLQLSTALHNILDLDKWDDMVTIIKNLIQQGDESSIMTGLICLYEYTRNYRWSGLSSGNPALEEVCNEIFPLLESLTENLINSSDSSPITDEMLYRILKIFKFTTFSVLPTYIQNPDHLGKWCQYHILIIKKPLPPQVLQEDDVDQRTKHTRVKTIKWCFANLHRLLSRHGGGMSTREKKESQFVVMFLNNFVPEILSSYFEIIENWSSKKTWLSEPSLYHLISFLEQLIDTPSWNLISDKQDAIIKHVLLPTLIATDETVELYEDDSEEYIRRFFDINRESTTADVASFNYLYKLASKKFKSTANLILGILNEVFNKRAANRNDLTIAKETEGALRMLSSIVFKLNTKASPVHGQIDKVLLTFVYPEFGDDVLATTPWLVARACDTIARFQYQYQDPQALESIFQSVVKCFQTEGHFPVQLTAVDALTTLVKQDSVAETVAAQAPHLMNKLLEMSKRSENEIIAVAMEEFVERFAKNLEPYAKELTASLCTQFLSIAYELLESGPDPLSYNEDREYQAANVLNTITTLIVSMNSSPEVCVSLEPIIQEMLKFILENAMISFLSEAMEILETLVFSTKSVSPTIWNLYDVCIDSFDTYALEYFNNFNSFFETVINYGFGQPTVTVETPQVQSLLNVCFKILKEEEVDPVFAHISFELIELLILALGQKVVPILNTLFTELYDIFVQLESEKAFDGYMLHHLSILRVFFAALYIDTSSTLRFLNGKQFIPSLFNLWMKHSEDFQSVYGCKLQILACLSIIGSPDITLLPEDLVGENTDILLGNIGALPNAIKARNEILNREENLRPDFNLNDEDEEGEEGEDALYDDDFEADEAEFEAMKVTPIDDVNVFEVFYKQLISLQHADAAKYHVLFGELDESKKELVDSVFKVVQSQQQQQQQQ